jgi:hypothetical protein
MSRLGNDAIRETAQKLAAAIANWQPDPEKLIFVAILRAGVPIADWLCQMLPGSITAAISLFVGFGIDRIALSRLQSNFPERTILFVDGWTGRGGVSREIAKLNAGPLAVLIDPWGWADFSGAQEDIFCPSACFTGVATLGFSRTFFVNNRNLFAAYKFPKKYMRKEVIGAWRELSPKQPTTPGAISIEKFYKSTELRIHGNEVCRALINAAPTTLFFADEQEHVKEHFSLLLALADRRGVPVKYNHKSLQDYRSCRLHLKKAGIKFSFKDFISSACHIIKSNILFSQLSTHYPLILTALCCTLSRKLFQLGESPASAI